MDREFWLERWESGRLGWHRDTVNPHLADLWAAMPVPAAGPIHMGESRVPHAFGKNLVNCAALGALAMCSTCRGTQAILVSGTLYPCPQCLPARWRAVLPPAERPISEPASLGAGD